MFGNNPDMSVVDIFWDAAPTTGQAFTVTAQNSCGTSAPYSLSENCSSPRSVTGAIADMSVYPNPTSGKLTVEYNTESQERMVLKVTDMAGRTVVERVLTTSEGMNHEEVDLSGVRKGMYMLYLTTEEGDQMVRRVSVQ